MNNRERLKLIIENWFVEKTSIKPTEEGLNNLVDRIYYDKQLNIYGVVGQSEQLCTCKNPKINDMRWSCDKCDKDFDNRYKGA